jgi:phage gp46-like protein
MADFQTSYDPLAMMGDWSVTAGDLTTDAGLRTAVILSLLSDATANADDDLYDGDRRGWWGDLALDGDRAGDRFGSRLWLLARAKVSEATRRRAVLMCRDALAWLIEDGIAVSVDIAAEWQGDDRQQLAIGIGVNRPPPLPASRYDILWIAEGAR